PTRLSSLSLHDALPISACVEHPAAAVVMDRVRCPHMGLALLPAGVQHRIVYRPLRSLEIVGGGVEEHRLVERRGGLGIPDAEERSEEHTSELQSRFDLV